MTPRAQLSRADEYRLMAKDCIEMRRPDLAAGFIALAHQEDERGAACDGLSILFDALTNPASHP